MPQWPNGALIIFILLSYNLSCPNSIGSTRDRQTDRQTDTAFYSLGYSLSYKGSIKLLIYIYNLVCELSNPTLPVFLFKKSWIGPCFPWYWEQYSNKKVVYQYWEYSQNLFWIGPKNQIPRNKYKHSGSTPRESIPFLWELYIKCIFLVNITPSVTF